jgi:predicted Fe-Mo cluster-binding NifX family protein
MSYKIAVASSDGKQIDETFGSAKRLIIYEVTEGIYRRLEERVFCEEETDHKDVSIVNGCHSPSDCKKEGSCGATGGGCGSTTGGGCGGAGEASAKVELVSDCRCVVCKKIGFHIQKQLERKAISAFDVTCPVEEALEKISHYFTRMDNHESLRVQK